MQVDHLLAHGVGTAPHHSQPGKILTLWKKRASNPPALEDVVVTAAASCPPPSNTCMCQLSHQQSNCGDSSGKLCIAGVTHCMLYVTS